MKKFFEKHKKAIVLLGAFILFAVLLAIGNDVLSPFNE